MEPRNGWIDGYLEMIKRAGSGPAFGGQGKTYSTVRSRSKARKSKKHMDQNKHFNKLKQKSRRAQVSYKSMGKLASQGAVGGFGSMVNTQGPAQQQPNMAYQPNMNNATGDQNALLPGAPSLTPTGGGKDPGKSYPGSPATSVSGNSPSSGAYKASAYMAGYLEIIKRAQDPEVTVPPPAAGKKIPAVSPGALQKALSGKPAPKGKQTGAPQPLSPKEKGFADGWKGEDMEGGLKNSLKNHLRIDTSPEKPVGTQMALPADMTPGDIRDREMSENWQIGAQYRAGDLKTDPASRSQEQTPLPQFGMQYKF
jgi:hypothetical protein